MEDSRALQTVPGYPRKKPHPFVCLLLFLPGILLAGITGKIAGRITDDQTGEPMVGVNVILSETAMGAATDDNGYYVILNVPPGEYTLKTSMIGYADVTARNVVVVMGQTTTLDIRMKTEVLAAEEITIVAERPVVVPDVSNSQLNVASETIETMPILDVTEVIGLQAGIQGLSVRGGSARQTAFVVDGIVLNDERSNNPYTSVSFNSVSEVQVQTGGFNAEYGDVRSGIINIVTKDALRDRYSGSFTLRIDPPGRKHFGPSVNDPSTYFLRPYLDPEVAYTGTASGAWDAYTQRQYPTFEGWNAVSEATLQDNDPTNDLTPEGARQLFKWQHRRSSNIEKPDHTLDITLGGPVPWISSSLGGLRFQFSYRDVKEMFIFPLSRESYDENIGRLKLTADINPNTRLTLTGMHGKIQSVSPYQWTTTPTGYVLRSPYEVANYVTSSSGNSIIYMPGWFSPSIITRTILGIRVNRVLSSRSFYEITLQHNRNHYNTYEMAPRDTSRKFEIVPGYLVDEAPFGYWGYGVTGIDGMRIGGWMNLGRDSTTVSTTTLRFDHTSQVNMTNQVKTGLQLTLNDFNIRSSTESPSMTTWTRDQVYRVRPFRLAIYAQDKLEFEGFIANLGVRLDYSDANSSRYDLEDYDPYFKEGNGHLIEEEAPADDAQPRWSLSPRLGVSHPITQNSKLYFNYGHFRQEPASSYRFRIQREYNGLVTSIGEPNLLLERTVAYELGYAHSLANRYLVTLAAYYKDVTNEHGWISYQNINNSVQYLRAADNNYEDIRGLELTLDKRMGRWVTGFINYTYEVRTFGYFGLTEYYEDPNKQREYLRQNPYQERPHPRPFMRTVLDFHSPGSFGPSFNGVYPLGGWNLNFLAAWRAGAITTYNPNNEPGVVDNVQWKSYHNVDLRLTKSVQVGPQDIQVFIDISNVFNIKLLSDAGFSDQFDYLDYMESLHFDWEEGIERGNDKIGEYRGSNVDFVPMQSVSSLDVVASPEPQVLYWDLETERYLQFVEDEWVERNASWVKKEILDKKAYIDMPNLTSFTFLNPRNVKIGVRANF
ncbi:MAG: carboxypeptidase regulatory-like domain-containing protein [Fidelibacterota bacterium]